jgi:hypothetical protein
MSETSERLTEWSVATLVAAYLTKTKANGESTDDIEKAILTARCIDEAQKILHRTCGNRKVMTDIVSFVRAILDRAQEICDPTFERTSHV